MTVYHGSTLEIRSPDVSHSKRFLDFGPAFYVTSYRVQAQNWARRKCARLPRAGSIPRAVELLHFARPNDQIALRTGRIIAEKLRFVEAYSLPTEA